MGYEVSPYYDSMISKLICYGETRAEAVLRMRRALEEGHRRFLEPAPGTILAGILRKIDGDAEVVPVSRPEEVEGALASVGAA